jgi:hypothetical protein
MYQIVNLQVESSEKIIQVLNYIKYYKFIGVGQEHTTFVKNSVKINIQSIIYHFFVYKN